MAKDMVMVLKYGLMVPSMKESGKIIRLMARVNFGMQMVISMKESGKMIKPMARECIYMLMGRDMRVTGETICRTVLV